jgi:hypothetical protein
VLAFIVHARGANLDETYMIKNLIFSCLAVFAPVTNDMLPLAILLLRRCPQTTMTENGGNK